MNGTKDICTCFVFFCNKSFCHTKADFCKRTPEIRREQTNIQPLVPKSNQPSDLQRLANHHSRWVSEKGSDPLEASRVCLAGVTGVPYIRRSADGIQIIESDYADPREVSRVAARWSPAVRVRQFPRSAFAASMRSPAGSQSFSFVPRSCRRS